MERLITSLPFLAIVAWALWKFKPWRIVRSMLKKPVVPKVRDGYRIYCPCGCGWGWEVDGDYDDSYPKGYDPGGNQDKADAQQSLQRYTSMLEKRARSETRGKMQTQNENLAGAVYGRTVIPNPIDPETGRRKFEG